jgi:murein DD-endopeptidase MepM/ murein hydrolase activator NlpD
MTMPGSRQQDDEENRELSFSFPPRQKKQKREDPSCLAQDNLGSREPQEQPLPVAENNHPSTFLNHGSDETWSITSSRPEEECFDSPPESQPLRIDTRQVANESETALGQPRPPLGKREMLIAENPHQGRPVSVLSYLGLFCCLLLFCSFLTFLNQAWPSLSAMFPLDLPSTEEMNSEAERPKNNPFAPLILIPQKEYSPFEGLDSLKRVTLRSKPGETKLLARFEMPTEERQQGVHSIEKHYPTKRFLSEKETSFYSTKPPPALTGQQAKHLKALDIELNEDSVSTWEKGNKGIIFRKREKPFDMELKSAAAVVENSSSVGGLRPALHPALLSQLADIFNWEVDFNKNLQEGDAFKLLYEDRTRKGGQKKTSFHILAAELMNAGQSLFAIYFEKEKGKGNYYDLDGRSLARAFLRFPLDFSSITSHFSHLRFNPILKVDVPHHGVDFAAKPGTPVRAIGNGKITYAGWKNGGYGRMVEIQHDSRYVSRYAHLQSLAQKIGEGATVQKGQIIGYVGSSGRTTGAHLHFELYEDQKYVDPLIFEIPPEDKIEPDLQRIFENAKQLLLARLAATPIS